jgi:hypothetical protein
MSRRRTIGLVVGGVISIGVICFLFLAGQLFSRTTRPPQWPEGDVLCFEGGGCSHAPKGQPRMNDPRWARKTMDNNPISESARGRPLHCARAWLTARRSVPRSPRPGTCTALARGHKHARGLGACSLGRKSQSAPPCKCPAPRSPSSAPWRAPCTLRPQHRR